jgi:hypothetical protein
MVIQKPAEHGPTVPLASRVPDPSVAGEKAGGGEQGLETAVRLGQLDAVAVVTEPAKHFQLPIALAYSECSRVAPFDKPSVGERYCQANDTAPPTCDASPFSCSSIRAVGAAE